MDLAILFDIELICSSKFNLASIVMPRYFAESLIVITLLSKIKSIAGTGRVVLGKIIKAEDFFGLRVILFAFVHLWTFSNSIFIFSCRVAYVDLQRGLLSTCHQQIIAVVKLMHFELVISAWMTNSKKKRMVKVTNWIAIQNSLTEVHINQNKTLANF